jgi:hypothetical protein
VEIIMSRENVGEMMCMGTRTFDGKGYFCGLGQTGDLTGKHHAIFVVIVDW